MKKGATMLFITVLVLSSLVMVNSASAQSIPRFTMSLVAHPYDVPTTFGVDEYTGENITIEEGYHVRNESVVFTIENQPISDVFFNIRSKGHFGDDWTERYHYEKASPGDLVPQSNTYGNTVISIPVGYPVNGAEIDFQVQAVAYHYVEFYVDDHPPYPEYGGHYEEHFALRGTSGWSKTQTMTFPAILPNVTLLLPQNASFSTSDVQLDFAVDQSVSQVEYSLDGGANVTVAGNTTLTGLPNGYHNITVYATNENGNTRATETVYFNVEVPKPSPNWLIIAVLVTVLVVFSVLIAALLLYFQKRREPKILVKEVLS
jgi:hypothetical protein